MAQTVILEEVNEQFSPQTGEVQEYTRRKVMKTTIEPTDEFFKVSRYLTMIFAFNNIPARLVGISLCFGQLMEFRTNKLYLLKTEKQKIADMLGCSVERVSHLIMECRKYDIIRPISRGVYEVNGFLFSSGSMSDTRSIQAHFDFDSGNYGATAEMHNRITGETVRKAVTYKNDAKKEIPGQMTFAELEDKKSEE